MCAFLQLQRHDLHNNIVKKNTHTHKQRWNKLYTPHYQCLLSQRCDSRKMDGWASISDDECLTKCKQTGRYFIIVYFHSKHTVKSQRYCLFGEMILTEYERWTFYFSYSNSNVFVFLIENKYIMYVTTKGLPWLSSVVQPGTITYGAKENLSWPKSQSSHSVDKFFTRGTARRVFSFLSVHLQLTYVNVKLSFDLSF